MKQLAGRYDNGATVDNEDAILASFQTRSAAIYHQTKHKKNIAYGESERETMDWLYSAKQHQDVNFYSRRLLAILRQGGFRLYRRRAVGVGF